MQMKYLAKHPFLMGGQMLVATAWLVSFAACGGSNSTPTVVANSPVNGATGVPLNVSISAAFSEAMDGATITSATVILKQATTIVASAVTYAGLVATLNPGAPLVANTPYTVSVTTGAENSAHKGLSADFQWSFTTGTTTSTTAPTVLSTNPAGDDVAVAVNQDITVTFSDPMNSTTLTAATFTVAGPGPTPVSGVVTYSGTLATFSPNASLTTNTLFNATITTGTKDLAGNALASDFVWSFTTGTTRDTTAPTVLSTSPAAGAMGAAINQPITATFSKAMNQTTLTTATFTVAGPHATSVSGLVTGTGAGATFSPDANLAANTLYDATITTGTKDLAGNALAQTFTWSFTTAAGAALGPKPVLLGLAGNFVILAKSGVSTTGTTAVTGNIGISPAQATYITGFGLMLITRMCFQPPRW